MKKQLSFVAHTFFIISLLIILSQNVSADHCVGNSYTFSCGERIIESCILDGNVSAKSGTCFAIAVDNVTMDCAGYSITGNETGNGIEINRQSGIKIINCSISNFEHDIYAKDSSNLQIMNNTLNTSGSSKQAVFFNGTGDSLVSQNKIYTNGNSAHGVYIVNSANNEIIGNDIHVSGNIAKGVIIDDSSGNLMESNNVSVIGLRAYGIGVYGAKNNKVIRNNVRTYVMDSHAIVFSRSMSGNISENYVETLDNYSAGIFLSLSANGNEVSGNTIKTKGQDSSPGIHIRQSAGNSFNSNLINNSGFGSYGFYFDDSNESILKHNLILNKNSFAIFIRPSQEIRHYSHDIDTSNTAFGGDILYLNNISNRKILPDKKLIGELILVNAKNIEFYSLSMREGKIQLANTEKIFIRDSYISSSSNHSNVIYSTNSQGLNILKLNVYVNGESSTGIYLGSSKDDIISDSSIMVNGPASTGIYLYFANDTKITNSTIKGENPYSLMLFLNFAINNTISGITANAQGPHSAGIYLLNSNDNLVKDSTITSSSNPLGFIASNNNLIYNNLIKSIAMPYITEDSSNYWNITKQSGKRIYGNGNEIGGNYWTNQDKTGYSDLCEDFDNDGFCDLSYVLGPIYGNNMDYLAYSDEFILKCSDGTIYNSCSSTKPLFCQNGQLINKCTVCGCRPIYQCNSTTNKCVFRKLEPRVAIKD